MSRNFYISDWHFGHSNIVAYDNRPFSSVEEMNAALIMNWNKAVTNEDTVYILGDMFWFGESKAIKILQVLNGHKILIRGNHDVCKNDAFIAMFDKIVDYLEIEDDGVSLVLSHYPIIFFKNHEKGWIHLYGHVHNSYEENIVQHTRKMVEELYEKPCKMINVGAMMPWINYTPRTLSEIRMFIGEYAPIDN